MSKHQIALSMTLLTLAATMPEQALPDGHLERINALQSAKGKPALQAGDVLVRPIRLFGNQLTSYFTRIRDEDLQVLADQINASGGPALSAHVTDETPIGTFYAAEVTPGGGDVLWLDTWVYFLNDAAGQDLARKIDGGVINEASIGYWYERNVCSITGLDYWYSPYYAGQEYEITDVQSGQTSTQLCFLWTVGNVEFAEGSLVYRGAYPGTQVGGDIGVAIRQAAANSKPLAAPSQTRFQLAASKDMESELRKKVEHGKPAGAPPVQGAPTPSTAQNEKPQVASRADQPAPERGAPDTDKEGSVKLTLKLKDGSEKVIDVAGTSGPASLQAMLDEQVSLAEQRGGQAERERLAASAGLKPAQLEGEATELVQLAEQAGDGRTYREDLLERLERVTLAVEGNGEAGQKASERIKKVFKKAEISDIREEVERLEARRDALVPSGQRSVQNAEEGDEAPTKPHKRDFDSV